MTIALPKAFVFGAGSGAGSFLGLIQKKYQVICLLDNDEAKWNSRVEGIPVCRPSMIREADYDKIVIASSAGLDAMVEQLIGMGVGYGRIDTTYVGAIEQPRLLFLEKLGELLAERGVCGSVAEAGVFQGAFAKEINRVFPAKKLFLFDTFSGFDARDLRAEREHRYSRRGEGFFGGTSEELVRRQLPREALCVIRKGYFPETAEGLDEIFCFVHLDLDLYQPTLAGLEYFYPRMAKGGVILVHDYFSDEYAGVKKAVQTFEKANGRLSLFPIGDLFSLGIQC
ncbi:MAG: macrocin-O-methyltransferase [Oscillospiraceae bacterium]|nr:macrocin-O-methyltransferase [Oscillospiraceae bacterium]